MGDWCARKGFVAVYTDHGVSGGAAFDKRLARDNRVAAMVERLAEGAGRCGLHVVPSHGRAIHDIVMAKDTVKQRLTPLKDRSTLRVTTIGRKTGKRHAVTVWFLVDGETVYLVTLRLKRDWSRNVMKNGHVELDIDGHHFTGRAKQITDAKRLEHVKALLGQKYWAAWVGSWFGMGPEGAFAVAIDG